MSWSTLLTIPDSVEQAGEALVEELIGAGAEIEWDANPADPQATIDKDEAIAEAMFDKPVGSRSLRVWRNHHALVVPRRFEKRDGFAGARTQCPLPVYTRKSGGTAVVHGPHILNISLGFSEPSEETLSMARVFGQLGDVLIPALGKMGVDAELSDVPLAHCPGIYTLSARGRKLAGTAAFIRRRAGKRIALVHANLALGTHERDLETITRFEEGLGDTPDYAASAHTDLMREIVAAQHGQQS